MLAVLDSVFHSLEAYLELLANLWEDKVRMELLLEVEGRHLVVERHLGVELKLVAEVHLVVPFLPFPHFPAFLLLLSHPPDLEYPSS